MRKMIVLVVGIGVFAALAAGAWAADRSQRRAKQIYEDIGSIQVRAGGVLNTTVEVVDSNRIANAQFDLDIVEDHREALKQLGFTAVHVQTNSGQTFDQEL